MTSDDFVKIFYSNFTPVIDWANIDEITWMYEEGLFAVVNKEVATQDEYIKRIDLVIDTKNGFTKTGENEGHLALKSFARDYLINNCCVAADEVCYEYPLIGFEVDVIDKKLHFPVECGDTNALKLEKYLALPSTKKMLILPYPLLGDVKIFEFCANPKFFEYIKHKEIFLNRQRSKYR